MKRWLQVLGLILVCLFGFNGARLLAQADDLPELHPQKIVFDPPVPVEQGEQLTIDTDIVNTGIDAQGFSVDFAWRILDGASNSWTVFESRPLNGLRRLDQEVTLSAVLDTNTLPKITKPTAFGLRVLIDPDGKINEQDEANNELRTSFMVFPTRTLGKPDLRPVDLIFTPASPVSLTSDFVLITSTISNTGDIAAPPFDVTISFCPEPFTPSSKTQLCPKQLMALSTVPGRLESGLEPTGTLMIQAELPFRKQDGSPLLQAGIYQIQIEVDPGTAQQNLGEVDEQDEANNVLTGFLSILGPELHPIGIRFGSSLVRQGETVDVTAMVRNDGSSAALGGYAVAFYVNGILFDTVEGPSIDPSTMSEVSARLNTGAFNLTAGRPITIRVVVDADNRISEADETNNSIGTSLTLLESLPDLPELHPKDIILTPPSPIEQGGVERLIINSAVVNTGSKIAFDFDIEFSYRAKGSLRWQTIPCTIPAEGCRSQSLGSAQEVASQGELPLNLLSGGVTYEIRVVVDPDDKTVELDENNNTFQTTFTVRIPRLPDLTISDFSSVPGVLTDVRRGQLIFFNADISNIGEVDAVNRFDVVCQFAAVDSNTDFSDPLGFVPVNPFTPCPGTGQRKVFANGLAVNDTRSAQFLFDTSALAPGSYEVKISIDSEEAIREANEFNNELFVGFISIRGPDLIANFVPLPGQIALPQLVVQTQQFKVGLLVQNVGLENANRFNVRVSLQCPPGNSISRQIDLELTGLGVFDSETLEFVFGAEENPQPLPVGECEFNAQVDTQNNVLEVIELNNFAEPFRMQVLPVEQPVDPDTDGNGTPGQVPQPGGGQTEADLVVANFDLGKTFVIQGTNFKFQFDVFNQGIQAANPFTVKVLYQRLGERAIEFASFRIAEGLDKRTSITLEAVLKTGELQLESNERYKIIVIVDFFNEVQESFEANNRQERWLHIV